MICSHFQLNMHYIVHPVYVEIFIVDKFLPVLSITAPQDAHKLVLEVAELLTASLSGLARHELTI